MYNAMNTIHAVFENGVFRPLVPVDLADQTKVEFEPRVVESATAAGQEPLTASDLLASGLVGIWAERADMEDSREFARRLRDQAQTRSHER